MSLNETQQINITTVQEKKRIKLARTFGYASESYDTSARLQRFSGKHL